jgi:hypothetical protein
MAALLVVAIDRTMSPPRALPCEKIHPFYFVPLFLIHDTRAMDDILVFAETRWHLRRAMRTLNQTLAEFKATQQPDETCIGLMRDRKRRPKPPFF